MWILSNVNKKENIHYLICGPSLNVSRDGPGHILLKDKTVSKAHASISLTYSDKHLSCPEKQPEVILCDLKSTNGTYHLSGTKDFAKLTPNEPVILKHGDQVRFGRSETFKVQYEPLVITTSQITSKQVKEELKECVKCLGAHLVKEWSSSCSLLVMNDLVLTTKTVCALAAGAHIVTPTYLTDMISAVKEKSSLPDVKDYLPILKEPSIKATEVSFFPDPRRKKIFCEKIFYFQNEAAFKKMKTTVTEAGGSPCMLSENNCKEIVCENSVLIKSTEKDVTNLSKFIIRCMKLLKNEDLYPIPESDIGLAVVYCSTDKYCNPKFRISGILQPCSNMSQQLQSLAVFATETQQELEASPSNPVSRTTIPESGDSGKSRGSMPSKGPYLPDNKNSMDENSVSKINKENIGKRKRSPNESNSPENKTQEPKTKKKGDTSTLSNTEQMTHGDEVDNISHFNPKFCSTEKLSPDKNTHKRKSDHFAVPETSFVKKNVRMSSIRSNVAETHQESLDTSSMPKSIPFDPYTLPSINVENFPSDVSVEEEAEEIPTQPFSDISKVKQESQNEARSQLGKGKEPETNEPEANEPEANEPEANEPEANESEANESEANESEANESEANESEANEKTLPNGSWIGGTSAKPHRKSPDKRDSSQTSFAKPNVATEVPIRDSNEFALPRSSQRKRRNRSVSNEVHVETNNSKRVKVEENNAENETIRSKTVVIKRSPSELQTEKTDEHVKAKLEDEKNLPFISTQCNFKKENADDEVSKLGQALERSLVVVEVVNLIRKVDVREVVCVPSNGLPNFKKFKKVLPHNSSMDDEVQTVLPYIIGGDDLNYSNLGYRRESFIATQPDLQEHLQMREIELRETIGSDDKFDTDFGFSSSVRSKRKGRW